MLEKLPSAVGRTLRRVRPGLNRIVARRSEIASHGMTLRLESPVFGEGGIIPIRFTADADHEPSSPPLRWSAVPDGTRSLALIVEDADSPTISPVVHAIAIGVSPLVDELVDGALVAGSQMVTLGKSSNLRSGWMPPDPPPGHGVHQYAFQLFALDYLPELARPGRHAFVDTIRGHVLAHGLLVGTYSR